MLIYFIVLFFVIRYYYGLYSTLASWLESTLIFSCYGLHYWSYLLCFLSCCKSLSKFNGRDFTASPRWMVSLQIITTLSALPTILKGSVCCRNLNMSVLYSRDIRKFLAKSFFFLLQNLNLFT